MEIEQAVQSIQQTQEEPNLDTDVQEEETIQTTPLAQLQNTEEMDAEDQVVEDEEETRTYQPLETVGELHQQPLEGISNCSIIEEQQQQTHAPPILVVGHRQSQEADYSFETTFENKEYLAEHAKDLIAQHQIPTAEGKYICKICSKQFGYKNGLLRHLRLTHLGEKPFECTICNRKFGYKHILLEHQNLHYGNRPYACPVCNKRFAARSNLVQHRNVHRKTFTCHMCGKKCETLEELNAHVSSHPPSPPLVCSLCSYRAKTAQDLATHTESMHKPQLMDIKAPHNAGGLPHLHQQEIIAIPSPQHGGAMQHVPHRTVMRKQVHAPNPLDNLTTLADAARIKSEGEKGSDDQDVKPIVPTFSTEYPPDGDQNDGMKSPLPTFHEMFPAPTSNAQVVYSSAGQQQITEINNNQVKHINGYQETNRIKSSNYSKNNNNNNNKNNKNNKSVLMCDMETQCEAETLNELDSILDENISKGKIFRCHHCDIIFFERPMYFLHVSLHGSESPWQCAICDKLCLNKSDFTLHFINQKHER